MNAEPHIGAIGSILTALRALPIWLLAGLALAAYGMLFIPPVGNVDATGFRSTWGVWIWITALTFTALTLARCFDAAIAGYREYRRSREARQVLKLIPRHQQRWWHLAKQRDDTYMTQMSLDVDAINLTDRPIRIMKVRIVKPRSAKIVHADASLPAAGTTYHSSRHPVPPRGTVPVSIHVMARGRLAAQGTPLRVTFGITDQAGEEHYVKVILDSQDKRAPRQSLRAYIAAKVERVRNVTAPKNESIFNPPSAWQHGGKFEAVDLILQEERRHYAACGRQRGGLGSLNISLQSEPNYGWTEEGKVPNLLWRNEDAKKVGSENVDRLMKIHGALVPSDRVELELYLLSHLHARSEYADVAYFIFLVLHRMGRTPDALRAARASLREDKVHGYSNLLGTLSGLVSHEHFDISLDVYRDIQKALEGDQEHDFRLKQKINLARLLQLDGSVKKKPATESGS
jgi:hypothetical protein